MARLIIARWHCRHSIIAASSGYLSQFPMMLGFITGLLWLGPNQTVLQWPQLISKLSLHRLLLLANPGTNVSGAVVNINPGIYQAYIISTCHLHRENWDVGRVCCCSYLTVTKSHTRRVYAAFSDFPFKTFQICHNFASFVIPGMRMNVKEIQCSKNLPELKSKEFINSTW